MECGNIFSSISLFATHATADKIDAWNRSLTNITMKEYRDKKFEDVTRIKEPHLEVSQCHDVNKEPYTDLVFDKHNKMSLIHQLNNFEASLEGTEAMIEVTSQHLTEFLQHQELRKKHILITRQLQEELVSTQTQLREHQRNQINNVRTKQSHTVTKIKPSEKYHKKLLPIFATEKKEKCEEPEEIHVEVKQYKKRCLTYGEAKKLLRLQVKEDKRQWKWKVDLFNQFCGLPRLKYHHNNVSKDVKGDVKHKDECKSKHIDMVGIDTNNDETQQQCLHWIQQNNSFKENQTSIPQNNEIETFSIDRNVSYIFKSIEPDLHIVEEEVQQSLLKKNLPKIIKQQTYENVAVNSPIGCIFNQLEFMQNHYKTMSWSFSVSDKDLIPVESVEELREKAQSIHRENKQNTCAFLPKGIYI